MGSGSITVLVVEDSPGARLLYTQALVESQFATFEVEAVENLAEAIAALSATRFAVVLLDLTLPDSEGLGTLDVIRGIAAGTPVVVLTGATNAADGREALRRGASDYLDKATVSPDGVARSLTYAVERHALRAKVQELEAKSRREREMDELERLSTPSRGYEIDPKAEALRQREPEAFAQLCERQARLVAGALSRRGEGPDLDSAGEMHEIGRTLGKLHAAPWDVVDLHAAALKSLTEGQSQVQVVLHAEAGRPVLVQVMSELVSYYRERVR